MVDIQIKDLPSRELYSTSDYVAISRALLHPELQEQRRNLELVDLQTRVFNNRIKPDLSLNASANLNAVDSRYPHDLQKLVVRITPDGASACSFPTLLVIMRQRTTIEKAA